MADQQQVMILEQGVDVWNNWRKEHPNEKVDLSSIDLSGMELSNINFFQANLSHSNLSHARIYKAELHEANLSYAALVKADLSWANLWNTNLYSANLYKAELPSSQPCEANLGKAILSHANLSGTQIRNACLIDAKLDDVNLFLSNLYGSDLTGADLTNADLCEASLYKTDLSNANLTGAWLRNAVLVETNLEQAILSNSRIYGISAWRLKGKPFDQSNLVITPDGEAEITVDDLQVAQFIYLLLNNQNVRNVIDTITSKAVLILGRFTEERKAILDALHAELRKRNYLPILFDFSGPLSRDITETVSTLAHLARFIIADITDAKSIPQELQAIVPDLPSVPVQPILLASQQEYGMFGHFKRYPWVLPTYYYKDIGEVVASLPERIIATLEAKVVELAAGN